jgi:hypothetical protein
MKRTAAALALGAGIFAATAMPDLALADNHRCSNFRSQAEAQAHYRSDPVGAEHGPEGHSNLDDNGDGIACEALPGPYDHVPVRFDISAFARSAGQSALPHAGIGTAADAGSALLTAVAMLACGGGAALAVRWRTRRRSR